MTREEWLRKATAELQDPSARLEAELLLCQVLAIDRIQLVTEPQEPIPEACMTILELFFERRRGGEPIAHILDSKEFYGRMFHVNRSVLIPRPETEHLVEEALNTLPHSSQRFLDLGTGSGCLAVTLLAERPSWEGIAVDKSEEALKWSRHNARVHEVAHRMVILHADFTSPRFWAGVARDLDLLITNPPYVSEEEYAALDKGVKDFEPKMALVPGPSGMEHIATILAGGRRVLRPGGMLLMEHGHTQGEAARRVAQQLDWEQVRTGQDLAGRDRYLIAIQP